MPEPQSRPSELEQIASGRHHLTCKLPVHRAALQGKLRACLLLRNFWVVHTRHAVQQRGAVTRYEAQHDACSWV